MDIKSSSAAFQKLMLNSGFELIVQKKVHSWPEALHFLQSLFPSCSIEQIWKRWLFISHFWSASLIITALCGMSACSRSSLCSICNRLAERKILEMLLMSVLLHPFVSHCKTVWIPVEELCIKTRRDFLLDLTVETLTHCSLVCHCLVLDSWSNCFMDYCIASFFLKDRQSLETKYL